MKKMVCDCGANDFAEDGKNYVCLKCGRRYSENGDLITDEFRKCSENVAKLINVGFRAYNNRNLDEAINAFVEAERLDPDNLYAMFFSSWSQFIKLMGRSHFLRYEDDIDDIGEALLNKIQNIFSNNDLLDQYPDNEKNIIFKDWINCLYSFSLHVQPSSDDEDDSKPYKVKQLQKVLVKCLKKYSKESEKIYLYKIMIYLYSEWILNEKFNNTEHDGYGLTIGSFMYNGNDEEHPFPEGINIEIDDYKFFVDKIKEVEPNFVAPNIPEKKVKNNSGGCYIATCVYGSYDCPPVWTLRRYRDFELQNTVIGRLFIKMYYLVSPHIVSVFGKNKYFVGFFKKKLDKMVRKLNKKGIDNTPYID